MLDNDYLRSIALTWEDFEESTRNIAKQISHDFPNYKNLGLGLAVIKETLMNEKYLEQIYNSDSPLDSSE